VEQEEILFESSQGCYPGSLQLHVAEYLALKAYSTAKHTAPQITTFSQFRISSQVKRTKLILNRKIQIDKQVQ